MQVPHLRHLSLDLPPCLGELTPVKQDTLTVELKSTAEAEEARIARPPPAEKTQLPDSVLDKLPSVSMASWEPHQYMKANDHGCSTACR
jgi:hypothetical protein